MIATQNAGTRPTKPYFKTVFYKGVELFVHRDESKKPLQLRLYDALSGWIIAAGMTKAEARYQGIKNPIEGKNEEELLQILENKLTGHDLKGEPFKDLITHRRGENPPREEQQAILKAYVEATAANRKAESKTGPKLIKAPATTKVALIGDQQPRKEIVKMPEIQQQRPRCNLILHCGAQAVDRVEVARVSTPRPTETWTPIPHISLLESVESSLRAVNLRIGNQSHALSADENQYFGLIELLGSEERDFGLVVGIRNSHNKTLPIGLVAGTSVFVCDNLSFNGSVRLMRRHTTNAQKDLPFLVSRGVGKLMEMWNQNDQRIAAYKECRIKDKTMHDLAIRAVDVGACTNRMLPLILKEWREPKYPCFAEKNCWAAYNSFTEVLKGNLHELPRRTEALTALMDNHVGLPAAVLN